MRKDSGFSFVELMTVIAILGILAGIAIPSFISWRANSQLSRASRDVYSSFQKAKIEAIRRNAVCAVKFRVNDILIYIEEEEPPYTYDGEIPISTIKWSDYPGIGLDTNEGGGFGVTFTKQAIFFGSDGLPRNDTNGLVSGTVFLTNQDHTRKNTVEVTTAGNIRIKQAD